MAGVLAGGEAAAQGGLSGLARSQESPFVPYERSYALVIGIGAYSEYPKLEGAVRDAEALATVLREDFDFEVTELIDEEASEDSIMDWLVALKAKATERDRVLVYFAGHGVSEQGAVGRAMGFLLPAPTRKGRHLTDGIRMRDISDLLDQAEAKHKMFIPDACYSGIAARRVQTRAVATTQAMSPTHLKKRVGQSVHVTMSGGASDEQVVDEYLGHGLFTGRLIAGLKGAADSGEDGWITHTELQVYLEKEVSQIASREWGRTQNPTIDAVGEGLFVFRNPTFGSSAPGQMTRFFRDVMWNRGELTGVGPLTPEEQSRREHSYRIERTEESVKVSKVNGLGHLIEGEEDTAVWEHFYSRSGVSEVEQKNARGHLQRLRAYPRGSQARMVQFSGPTGVPVKVYSDRDLGSSDAVYGEYYTYDKNGYVERRRYQSLSRLEDPRPKDGSWGERYVRDHPLHLPTRAYFLGKDGSDAPNIQGVAYKEYSYDDNGALLSLTTVGPDGKPVGVDGRAAWVFTVDSVGNVTELQAQDASGKPVLTGSGYAYVRFTYSDRGEESGRTYFDEEGGPTLNSDGVHEIRIEPGPLGHSSSEAFFGVDGSPVLSKDGYHRVEFTRIERAGWILSEDYLGVDGKSILGRDGYARVERKPNERGDTIWEAYFDTGGQPTLNRNHVASWEMVWSDNGSPVSKSYFNVSGEPTFHSDGYAGWRQEYDPGSGYIRSSTALSRTGQPIQSRSGFCIRKYEHDDQGRKIRQISLDSAGKPSRSEDYEIRFRYDDQTDLKVALSRRAVDIQGWMTVQTQYDELGRVVEQKVYGEGQEAFVVEKLYGTILYFYDARGNQIRSEIRTPDGKINEATVTEYDARGREVFEAELLPDGQQRFVVEKKRFDDRGQLVEELSVRPSRAGEPDSAEAVRWIQRFDPRGNLIERAALNKDGEPVSDEGIQHYGCTVVKWSDYDERDRAGRVRCLDGDGKVIMEVSRGSGKGPSPVDVRLKADPLPWMAFLESDAAKAYGFEERRASMVQEQLGRTQEDFPGHPVIELDPAVVAAMSEIPMEVFVQPRFWRLPERKGWPHVYWDRPIGVGHEESISQPWITAQQLSGLKVKPGDKILELKTASGYQAVVLEKLGAEVYTIETDLELASRIRAMFSYLGTRKVHLGLAHDCYHGWPEKGPFDGIIATAAYPAIPRELVDQLKVGGRLVAPIGVDPDQWLMVYEKQADGSLKVIGEPSQVRYSMIPRP